MEKVVQWLQDFVWVLPWIGLAMASVIALIVLVRLLLQVLDYRRLRKQKSVFLELTPYTNTDKPLEATQRLFAVLHGLEAGRPFMDKLLRRKVVFSLEVVSTKKQGVRYIARVAEEDASTFEQTVASYLPDVRIHRVDDYLSGVNGRNIRVLDVKQTGHFAYPLQWQGELKQHDPIAYLTGAMTKLASDELMSLQVVVSPAKVRKAAEISTRLLHNEELLHRLGKRQSSIGGKILGGINTVLFGILDSVGEMASGTPDRGYRPSRAQLQHRQQAAMKIKPARMLSPLEQKLADSVQYKLNQPLFRVNIRALIAVERKSNEKQRIKGIKDWLALFNVPKYQSLRARSNILLSRKRRSSIFGYRLPSMFDRNTLLLSASELADLYHFPHTETGKTENVVRSLSKTLPAPLAIKNGKFDVVLGRNHHHGASTDIGLTATERERHVFIVGGTGNGKTTMIEYAAVQDIRSGKGVAIIDPHGDLAERLLSQIPEERIQDVIYFNPSDLSYPIGLNLLELPEGLEGDELLDAKDFITEAVISVMRKTFSDDDTGGHRIEYILRNATQTALTIEGATLFSIFDLLTDSKYRRKVVRNLKDQKLKNFWSNEFGKAGSFQQVKMAAGVTAKIGRFQFSASAERIMSQPKSTINFEEILDGKILICNFAKGLIGEDTSELFGISTLAKLQLAAYRRVKQKQADRKPFYLYVDEFQNFATMSFVQMLSEARKYKLFLTMAEQSTSQQDQQRLVDIILANVGTVACFRSGSPADERLVLPLFMPHIEQGEIANLPAYSYYIRISAVHAQEPMSGMTVFAEDVGDESITKRVIKSSRKLYAKKIEGMQPVEPRSEPIKKSGSPHEPKKNHATNKANDDLAEAKPVA